MDKETGGPQLVQKSSPMLFVAAASALLGAVGMGAVLGWTSPALEDMKKNSTSHPIPLTSDDEAWIGSSMTLGALVGALISGPMAQFLGRKKALISYGLPFTLGWLVLAFARSVPIVILGRVIVGFSAGIFSGTAPSYVVEISVVSIRGFLGACFQLCVTIGILLVYVFGAFLTWNVLAGIAAVPTIIMAILMVFMPETPTWLVAKNKKTDAEDSLAKLRGAGSDKEQELAQLQEQNRKATQEGGQSFSYKSYLSRQHGLPLLLSLGLMFFQQFSGINAVMFYSTSIFVESGSSIDANVATIIIGVAQVIATIAGSLLVDRLGRKMLLNASSALHIISTGGLGLYYFFTSSGEANSFGWVPVVCLVIFIIGFSIGFGPIPWLMVAEITPSTSRSATSALATCANWTFAFLISKFFGALKIALTKGGTFAFFATCCLLAMVFVTLCLPETKGRSHEEIQSFFADKETDPLKNGNNQSSTGDRVEMQKLNA